MDRERAFCINLDREPHKYQAVTKEFSDIFDITHISAVDGKQENIPGSLALLQTNLQIFNSIIKDTSNPQYCIIIEDDIYKHTQFSETWPRIREFIKNPENVWDFISLDFLLNFEKPTLEVYNDFLYKVGASRMTGCMIYNVKFIRENIDYLNALTCLDMTMTQNATFIKLIPRNLIIRQLVNKVSLTANMNTNVYEKYYSDTELYLKNYKF